MPVCWGLIVIGLGDLRVGQELDMSVTQTLSNSFMERCQHPRLLNR